LVYLDGKGERLARTNGEGGLLEAGRSQAGTNVVRHAPGLPREAEDGAIRTPVAVPVVRDGDGIRTGYDVPKLARDTGSSGIVPLERRWTGIERESLRGAVQGAANLSAIVFDSSHGNGEKATRRVRDRWRLEGHRDRREGRAGPGRGSGENRYGQGHRYECTGRVHRQLESGVDRKG
jgi:hypothetical protein